MTPTRIRVVVTAEDIAEGRKRVFSCPIREALLRQFPDVAVGVTVWTPKRASEDSYPLPKKATAFIRAFDGHRPVQPTTFYLEGPDR